ncbi:MAG: PQQ-binding-like beta-propeller repeat protein [Alphaproteobacteria bacterium]|nr:PQQ-binding-like beta-propeller repeat protein [Alphaproteobacteria bacterium]
MIALCTCAVAACSSDGNDEPLPGERISVLQLQKAIEPDNAALDAQGFVAPQPWANEFWPQAGGYPNHSMQNLLLNGGALNEVWTTKIGDGSRKGLPLTAQPIIVDGKVFTLDTDHRLSAFTVADGKKLWSVDVSDANEEDSIIGGGISYSRGQLYITNGYDELVTVNPADGSVGWRTRLPAPSRAAPTVLDDRVFITTMDSRILALSALDGSLLWQFAGVSAQTGLLGAAAPAATSQIVVPAFSSGEIYALRVENGSVAWSENLAAYRRTTGLAGLADIRGLPIIDKGVVIAISFGGLMTAIDERTGNRIWQREFGGSETPWVAGNHVFVISSENELVAMGRDNGVIRWVTQLPRYENEEKRRDPLYWTGPVLAGGRLIVAGSNGHVIEIIPENGETVRHWTAGKSFRVPPVVAGETLYLLDENGTLRAFK